MNGYDAMMPVQVRRGMRAVQFFIGLFAVLSACSSWSLGGWFLVTIINVAAGFLILAVGHVARIAWLAGYTGGSREALGMFSHVPCHFPAAKAAANITAGQRVGLQRTKDGPRIVPLSQ